MDKKSIKIVKLDINEEDDFSGVDSIALVESPAIESNWVMFSADVNKELFDSYTDYPDGVKNNAKRGIELNEKVDNKCATQVGKVRAQQLAKGEPISVETIKRMYSYLSRAEVNYDEGDSKACGTISYLLWGGLAGKRWAESKLKELDLFEGDLDVSGLPDFINEPSGSLVVKDIYDETEEYDKAIESNMEDYVSRLFDLLGYMDELPVFSTKEEAEEVSLIAGCSGAHEHLLGDLTVWMPCESHEDAWDSLLKELFDAWTESRMKSFEDLSDNEWEAMKDYLDSVALDAPKEDFNTIIKSGIKAPTAKNLGTSFLDTHSDLTGITTKKRYRYAGGLQSNSREFCKYLVNNFTNKGKVFRKEDINNMSLSGVNTGLGPNGINQYNIFLYRGGNNCKHTWEEVIYKVKGNKVDDVNKEVRTIADLQTIIAPRVPQSELVITPLGIGTNLSKQDFSEQQIVAGPFMIPSKLIYRKDERGEYYVYFSEETIQKIAYKYMQNKYTDNANIEHNEDAGLKDVFVVESWLVADPKRDKSLIYSGGEEYPKGTWYGLMKVKNKNVWEDYVKTGEVKGFSVEGFFIDELLNKSETEG